MLDITYPLFGGAIFLTTMCAACLWGQVSQLRRRIVALETRPSVVLAAPQPDPQPPIHRPVEIYTPPAMPYPPPSAPAAQGMYYDDRVRTAII